MKKVLFILAALILFYASSIFAQTGCNAPNPIVNSITSSSVTISWAAVPNAQSYVVKILAINTLSPLQEIETVSNSTTFNGLISGNTYEIQMYSKCDKGVSKVSKVIVKSITVQDFLIFRLIHGNFTSSLCKTIIKNACFKKGERLKDVLRYGGNTFTISNNNGQYYQFRIERAYNGLSFRSIQNNSNDVAFSPVYSNLAINNTVIPAITELTFYDINNPSIILWRIIETRDYRGNYTFDIVFNTEGCLTTQECTLASNTDCDKYPLQCQNDLHGLKSPQNNSLSIYPNPSFQKATIQFDTDTHIENAEINIYNINGTLINTLYQGTLVKGSNHFEWENADFQRGLYFIELKTPEYKLVKKLSKL